MLSEKEKRRILTATIAGSVLGIFCVVGIGLRLGFHQNYLFLASAWVNRVVMGFVIGLSSNLVFSKRFNYIVRGAILGLFISLAWFFSTDFRDPLGFLAGIVYGVIIDYIATRSEKK